MRRATANQQSGLKATIFVAISEGLRVGSVTFRAISAGIGRELGGLSTHRRTAKRHRGAGFSSAFCVAAHFLGGWLVEDGRW
jgi:hypothetical protein